MDVDAHLLGFGEATGDQSSNQEDTEVGVPVVY
jgi:hypothetical protein